MGYFFLAWLAGVVLRYLFLWAAVPTSELKQATNLKQAAVAAALGLVAMYVFRNMNAQNWIIYVVIGAAGFMSKYIVEGLSKLLNKK